MSDVSPGSFQIADSQFAARAFAVDTDAPEQTVGFGNGHINNTRGLSISGTGQGGSQPAQFSVGDQVELSWTMGASARSMTGTVTRADAGGSGQEGTGQVVVFSGVLDGTGEPHVLVMDLAGPVVPNRSGSYHTNGGTERATATCLTAGSLVATPGGPRRIEELAVGDAVLTLDHGPQPIRWIGRRRLGRRELAANPRLRPIRISAGALAPGLPARDLRVSPQHRMLLRSRIAGRMYAADEVLVAAVHLTDIPGIARDAAAQEVVYIHLMFDRHEILFAEGAPTESLYLGPMARQSLPAAALEELFTLFPALADATRPPDPARTLARGRRARKLVARHRDHARPLLA